MKRQLELITVKLGCLFLKIIVKTIEKVQLTDCKKKLTKKISHDQNQFFQNYGEYDFYPL